MHNIMYLLTGLFFGFIAGYFAAVLCWIQRKEENMDNLGRLLGALPFFDEDTKGSYQVIEDPVVEALTDKAALVNGQWVPLSTLRTNGEDLYITQSMYAKKF